MMIHFFHQNRSPSIRHCVFAHYDKSSSVADYVHHYLLSLKEAGFQTIFVSTSKSIEEESIERLKTTCIAACTRPNSGYDFGSYKKGIELLISKNIETETLLLANDSVYGPIFPLQPIIAKWESGEFDVMGLTDSYDPAYHLQSYFLLFNKNAVKSVAFNTFWNNVGFINDDSPNFKQDIILEYEVGGSQAWASNKMNIGAAFSLKETLTRMFKNFIEHETEKCRTTPYYSHKPHFEARLNQNTSHVHWRELIEIGFPFIKKELLTKNPLGLDIYDWPSVIYNNSKYDISLILRNLLTTGKGWSLYRQPPKIEIADAIARSGFINCKINPTIENLPNTPDEIEDSITLYFDELNYLERHPDVAAEVHCGNISSGLEHFKRWGIKDGREFNLIKC